MSLPKRLLIFLLMKHPNRYDLPKGHQEESEQDIDTAFRELFEETAISKDQVALVDGFRFSSVYYPTYARFNKQKVEKTVVIFACYLNENTVSISLGEHQGYEWVEWKPPQVYRQHDWSITQSSRTALSAN